MHDHTSSARSVIARVMACVLALVVGFGLAGCGDQTAAVEGTVTTALDQLKNPDEAVVQEWFGSDYDDSELESYGTSSAELVSHMFKQFDYSIESVTIENDTATVELSCTMVDVNQALTDTQTELQSADRAQDVLDAYTTDGETGLMKLFFEQFYEIVDAAEPKTGIPATLTLTRSGNTWTIDDDSATAFITTLMGSDSSLSSLTTTA